MECIQSPSSHLDSQSQPFTDLRPILRFTVLRLNTGTSNSHADLILVPRYEVECRVDRAHHLQHREYITFFPIRGRAKLEGPCFERFVIDDTKRSTLAVINY